MKWGLEDRHVSLLEEMLLKPLTKTGASLWVFGSRARGDHQKFSDLDVLVDGALPASLLSSIREQLEESSLPITVDIVPLNELAESYKKKVLSERKTWYAQ